MNDSADMKSAEAELDRAVDSLEVSIGDLLDRMRKLEAESQDSDAFREDRVKLAAVRPIKAMIEIRDVLSISGNPHNWKRGLGWSVEFSVKNQRGNPQTRSDGNHDVRECLRSLVNQ